jgi:hypothetical protein
MESQQTGQLEGAGVAHASPSSTATTDPYPGLWFRYLAPMPHHMALHPPPCFFSPPGSTLGRCRLQMLKAYWSRSVRVTRRSRSRGTTCALGRSAAVRRGWMRRANSPPRRGRPNQARYGKPARSAEVRLPVSCKQTTSGSLWVSSATSWGSFWPMPPQLMLSSRRGSGTGGPAMRDWRLLKE